MKPSIERFAVLLRTDDATLDRLCAVAGQIDQNAPPEDDVVAVLDEFAAEAHSEGIDEPEALLAFVFGNLGFRGNRTKYYSPLNSLIHHAVERRRGIPLTLSIIVAEVGRRIDVPMTIVGMPGHALMGDSAQPTTWYDPFGAGRALDVEDCERIFSSLLPTGTFTEGMLAPITPNSVVARMLQNLRAAYLREGDLGQLAATLQRRVVLPAAPHEDRVELANVLAALGREDQAADQRDMLAKLQPSRADTHKKASAILRARRN